MIQRAFLLRTRSGTYREFFIRAMIGTRKSGPCRNYLKNDSKGPSCCVPDQVHIGNFLLGHTLLLPDQVLIIHRACLISFLLGMFSSTRSSSVTRRSYVAIVLCKASLPPPRRATCI